MMSKMPEFDILTVILLVAIVFVIPGATVCGQPSDDGAHISVQDAQYTSEDRVSFILKLEDKGGNLTKEPMANSYRIICDNRELPKPAIEDMSPSYSISIACAVDTSGSMRRRLDNAKKLILDFLSSMPPNTRVALYSFNDTPRTECSFSSNSETLKKAVSNLRHGGNYTALYDVLVQASADLEKEKTEKKILFLITDGKDEKSKHSLQDVLSAIKAHSVYLAVIALGNNVVENQLKAMIAASEGFYYVDRVGGSLQPVVDDVLATLVPTSAIVKITSDLKEFAIPRGNPPFTIMVLKDAHRASTETKVVLPNTYKYQDEPSESFFQSGSPPSGDTSGPKISVRTFQYLFFGTCFFLLLLVLILYLRKRKGISKQCQKCGAEIPDYLDDCIHCSDALEGKQARVAIVGDGTSHRALMDTDPLMDSLDKRLERTLVLLDVPSLNQVSSDGKSLSYDLSLISELSIGRSLDCDITVADKSVSSQHARIIRIDDAYHVEDLNSTNGTFLNERKIPLRQPQMLSFGDRVRIGQTQFVYQLEQRRPEY